MRPRPDAAENHGHRIIVSDGLLASMRPRPDAAENVFPVTWEKRAAAVLQ